MKPASKVAMCGICSALSVLILFLGGIIPIFAYVCPMITGLIMIILVNTFGYPSAFITYFVVSVMGFFIVPDKECHLMYVFFFGYYTILRMFLAKIKPKVLLWLSKIIIFNVALVLENLVLFYVFAIPFASAEDSKAIIIVFWIMMNLVFVFYERLLGLMDIIYKRKIEKRIKRVIK